VVANTLARSASDKLSAFLNLGKKSGEKNKEEEEKGMEESRTEENRRVEKKREERRREEQSRERDSYFLSINQITPSLSPSP
jgi:hypothetical protein